MLQGDEKLVKHLTVVSLRDCSHWANQDRCCGGQLSVGGLLHLRVCCWRCLCQWQRMADCWLLPSDTSTPHACSPEQVNAHIRTFLEGGKVR